MHQTMKGARNENDKQSKQGHVNRPRPEIRDNLDSRNNLEMNDSPSGHNRKETHNVDKDEHNEKRGSRPKH